MTSSIVKCPAWLATHLKKNGGSVSFYDFMDLCLNDPCYGAYSTGNLKIGKKGDFCTSPSLSTDFAQLLAIQLIDWLNQIIFYNKNCDLFSVVEIGPGEGTLVKDLIEKISNLAPYLISKIEFILVEKNEGMKARQQKLINKGNNIRVRWSSLEQLRMKPIYGIIFH